MKYDKETADKIAAQYAEGMPVEEIALALDVPKRSVIAKLSNMGVYKRKTYLNKNGEPSVKKDEYIERIAALLDVNQECLESLEKVNKSVLILLEHALE